MTLTQDEKSVVIYSGYSKKALKKDVDKGTIHEDLFILSRGIADAAAAWRSCWLWAFELSQISLKIFKLTADLVANKSRHM